MPPFFVLVHIPKTGGTSLRMAAARHFRKKRLLLDYGPEGQHTSKLVRELVHQRKDPAALHDAALAGGFRMLAGHFPLDRYRGAFAEACFISWLRDPVDRVWSAWRHHRRKLGYEGDFESFYTNPRYRNQQVRMLGGSLDALDFVGVTEHYAESLSLLSSRHGLTLPLVLANRDRSTEPPPEPEVRAAVLECNLEDQALHQDATRRILDGLPPDPVLPRPPGWLRRWLGR